MTRAQRTLLGAVSGLTALVLVGLLVAAIARGDGDDHLAVGGASARSSTVPESTETTYALVPVTGGAPLPTTTVAPPPKPPPPPPDPGATGVAASPSPTPAPTTGGPPPPPALTGDGAQLTKPADTESTRPIDKRKGCFSAADPGWKVVDCGALKRSDVVLLWIVESKGSALRTFVLRERTAGQWSTTLAALDADGTRYAKVGVRGEDVNGDGKPELVFGFHSKVDKSVGVDVTEGATVGLHVTVLGPTTSVRPSAGRLDTWGAQADGSAIHQELQVISGSWRVAASETVPKSSVPPSMV